MTEERFIIVGMGVGIAVFSALIGIVIGGILAMRMNDNIVYQAEGILRNV